MLAWELVGSLVAGVLIGIILAVYLRKIRSGGGLFVLTVCFVIAEVGRRLHFDPLLVALSAGVFIRNATSVGQELHREIEASALPVYVMFFAVAGATIHLDVLAVVGVPAVIFVLVRATGFLFGARIGARFAGAPENVRRHVGFGLLPRAGLALALSMLFAKTFPEFGAEAGALMLGVVAINEVVAPALYRFALVRSGEAGRREATELSVAEAPAPVRALAAQDA
jgi:Kef-type K+ transport system membrane component KefB